MSNIIVNAIETLTSRVKLFRCTLPEDLDGNFYHPGAHVDIELPNGLVRQYSLLPESGDTDDIVFAVLKETGGRGGSAYLHNQISVGDEIRLIELRNNFPLIEEGADHTVLIAGGIGITPILGMWQRAKEVGLSCELHYAGRSIDEMAFSQHLLGEQDCTLYCPEVDAKRVDIRKLVKNDGSQKIHYYCCGPQRMIDAFQTATQRTPSEFVHLEQFSNTNERAKGGFTVIAERSGLTVFVEETETVAEALLAAGINVPLSCQEGVCGSCETPVLSGRPDHRDSVLSEAEKSENATMMVCCSGSKDSKLVLDI